MEREELIDKYLQSTLTPSERDQFDSLLQEDETFRSDVTLLENLQTVSGVEDRAQLRKSMANFEEKIANTETKVIPLFSYKKLLVAASILLVIGIGGITFFNPFATDTNSLYAANFEPYKNVVTPIIRGENNDSDEVNAFTSYEAKDYESSATQFGALYETSKKPYFLLYQGNSLLATDKTNEAIIVLEKHITLNDELVERGKWYLSLAYLKENQTKKAITLLEALVQKGKFKKGAAEQLLTQLQ